ncbi:MAG TPA: DUF92 domain-containing protein [Cytophagaceae bacterium]|nr:DUF92 domain-containing protein [Cytophagaceae bacterium]
MFPFVEFYAQLIALLVSIFSYKKKSVALSGFLSMVLISSFFIWNKGIAPLCILFAMFASASLLTHYKEHYKSSLTSAVIAKHGPRDYIQAICNLGVASFCFLMYTFTQEKYLLLVLLCSVAASNADSWASEIGVLSKKTPVMITNFKPCRPGISGGITLLGTLAGICGSMFIALLAVLLKQYMLPSYSSFTLFTWITLAGTFGLLLDSLLGATVQKVYQDNNGQETENTLLAQKEKRGWKGINNDVINLLNAVFVAVLVWVCYLLLNT